MADEEPSRVALEEVTHAAFAGVLRALEARKIPPERFPGPILVGIIAWPELSQLPNIAQPGGPLGGGERPQGS
jgi:hypothetical protein